MKSNHIKTPEQVKEEFKRRGISVSSWAKQHGFKREYVHSILRGDYQCNIGTGHKIAVLLGMKSGEITND